MGVADGIIGFVGIDATGTADATEILGIILVEKSDFESTVEIVGVGTDMALLENGKAPGSDG